MTNYLTRNDFININQMIIQNAGEDTTGIADSHGIDAIVEQPQTAFFDVKPTQ